MLHTWPVSTGRIGRFTPAGNFRAFRMEKDHYSKEFDDAPMPNSIFFTNRGHAIHGSFDTKKLGRPASGGCVRLAPENAAVLFEMVKAEGVLKTKVSVSGDERVAIARADRELRAGEQPAGRARHRSAAAIRSARGRSAHSPAICRAAAASYRSSRSNIITTAISGSPMRRPQPTPAPPPQPYYAQRPAPYYEQRGYAPQYYYSRATATVR